MKLCSKCGLEKSLGEFSSNGSVLLSDGKRVCYRKSACKKCNAALVSAGRRLSKRRYLMNQWGKIKNRCESRDGYVGMYYPNIDEYVGWAISRPDFIKHYGSWVASGFDMQESPSIDRINVAAGYEFQNMQFISFRENSVKDRKLATKLVRFGKIYEFESRAAAVKGSGLSPSSIHRLAMGRRKQINGWSFA